MLTVDYRLAPEHPFPAALDDALAAWRWLHGLGLSGLAIAGDSAGGGLALGTLLAARDAGLPPPAAYVGMSPWTDLEGSGRVLYPDAPPDPMLTLHGLDWSAELYAAGAERDPRVSPVLGDLRGLPPMLLQVGTADLLHSDSVRLAERARAAGVPVTLQVEPGLIHVWHTHADLPESKAALAQIGAFLRERWAQSAGG